jgi:tetratricopeptide (TPR) repeat protein
MQKTRVVVFLSVIFACVSLHSFGGELPQRRPRQSGDVSNGIDSLGLWQPESVRAILLLYSGKNLTKAKADDLEAAVRKDPEKIDERLVLIGYYSSQGKTQGDRTRLRTLVLWMVEKHPEHPATAEPSLRDLPDDVDGNLQIMALWQKHLESHADDIAVLKNAEKFFFSKDPAKADQLVHRIAEKEPTNQEWPNELAQLYRMFGIPGEHFDAPQRADEAYKRVLALTRNPIARESLAGEMAVAAFKMGDFPGAAEFAKIQLGSKDKSAPQRANTILGRVALRSGDVASAKQYLLDSSKSEAANDISLSGPSMSLAKELLEKGERETVLQYLDNCLTLWPRGENVLQVWIADIRKGKTPNFGNLGF